MKYIILTITFLASFTLFSCEDVIPFDVKDGVEQLVVDAWITDEVHEQKIKLTLSQPYFDNSTPKPALGAEVSLINFDNSIIKLTDKENKGEYTFTPNSSDYIIEGKPVRLSIKFQNEEYISASILKRVPKIDSLDYEPSSVPNGPPDPKLPKEGFIAQFYAHDPKGEGDTYLIRTILNDTLKFKPNEFQLAYDAGFSPGSKSDGLLFILPIRRSITQGLLKDKDKLKVELFSIPVEAYYYLQQLRQESNNGGIFATPLSNIPTNIINTNTKSNKKALGAFFVSKVSRIERTIDKSLAKPKKQ